MKEKTISLTPRQNDAKTNYSKLTVMSFARKSPQTDLLPLLEQP